MNACLIFSDAFFSGSVSVLYSMLLRTIKGPQTALKSFFLADRSIYMCMRERSKILAFQGLVDVDFL